MYFSPSLRTVAEKLTTDVTDAFEEKFGVRPREAYGATELSPLVAANVPPSRHVPGRAIDAREGTVGKPILGCTAKITDREGFDELPIGEEGLLWIHGPNVMQGYLESSNVSAIEEMIGLIEVSRAHEANQKMIQTWSELGLKLMKI